MKTNNSCPYCGLAGVDSHLNCPQCGEYSDVGRGDYSGVFFAGILALAFWGILLWVAFA